MQNENYKSIKLDKGMYLGEGTFSEKLAAMDLHFCLLFII